MGSENVNKVSVRAEQFATRHGASPRREPARLRRFGIGAGFAALLGLMALLGTLGVLYLDTSEARLERIVSDHMTKIELASRMHQTARERTVALQKMILLDDPFERDEQWMQFNNRAGEFAAARGQLLELALAPEERALLDRQGRLTGKAVPLQERVAELVSQDRRAEAHRLLVEQAIPAQDAVLAQLAQFYAQQKDAADAAVKQAYSAHQNARALLVVFSLALPGLGLVIATTVVRRTKRDDVEMRKLSSAIEQTADAIVITNPDGLIEYVNPAYEETTGYRRDEAVGQKPGIVKSGLLSEAFYKNLWQTILRGEVFRGLFINRRKNGELYYEQKTITPLKNAQGQITYFVSTGKDISDRIRAETMLRDSEERFRAAFMQAAVGIVMADTGGRLQRVNQRFADMLGYIPEDLIGRHFQDFTHPDDREESAHHAERLLAGEAVNAALVKRYLRRDGGTVWGNVGLSLVRDERGEPRNFIAIIENITERKRAEVALSESERRYHAMAEVSPVGIFRTDMDGKCLYVNRRWCAIAGIAPEKARGDGWAQSLHPEDRERVFAEWNRAARENRPFQMEYRFHTPEGVVTWVLGQAIAERDDRGQPVGYIGTITDITQLRLTEEKSRLQAQIIEQIHDSVVSTDLAGYVTTWNRGAERLFGYTEAEALGRHISFVYPPEEHAFLENNIIAPLKQNGSHEVEVRMRRKSGKDFHANLALSLLRDATGHPFGMIGYSLDITERKRAEVALSESEERFRALVETTSDWIWETDARGIYTYASPRIEALLGYAPEEIVGKSPFDLMPPEEAGRIRQLFAAIAADRKPIVRLENVNLHKDGRRVVLETNGIPIFDRNGEHTGYRGIDRDITERKHAEEQLNYLAYYDTLTGLPNRALLLERLKQATLDAERVNRLVAVMFLDLDRFKYINDTLGHHVGDGLLRAVAERLQSCVRPGDTIARLGGDEFTVVLANVAHVDDVARVARKLIDSFARPFQVDGHELFTTTSIGVTLYPFDERDAEGLLKNADTAMYHAKERGRNTFQYFTSELNVRAERRLRIETALRQALERHELSLHYQPQVDLKTGKLTGMEALARWHHPELGNVSPAEFIPVAEETGLILPIGEWVLREACRQIKAWHDTGFHKLQVAVNISGKQLRQKDFPDLVQRVLKDTGLRAVYLDLELTESLLMVDTRETAEIMHALHATGVSFSVDDFGTGYSSLAYLKRFPIDVLKIDRSFVRDIASDPNDVAIVKTVIAMAHTLGMRVIAEGVETHEQLQFLRGQGCDGSQGYYCSMPLSAQEFSELLADWKHIRATRCELARKALRASPKHRPAKAASRPKARRKRPATSP